MHISSVGGATAQQPYGATPTAGSGKAAATDSDGDNDGSTSSAASLPQGSTFSIKA